MNMLSPAPYLKAAKQDHRSSADGGDDSFLLSKVVDRSCRNLARCEEDLGCVGDAADPIELGQIIFYRPIADRLRYHRAFQRRDDRQSIRLCNTVRIIDGCGPASTGHENWQDR